MLFFRKKANLKWITSYFQFTPCHILQVGLLYKLINCGGSFISIHKKGLAFNQTFIQLQEFALVKKERKKLIMVIAK